MTQINDRDVLRLIAEQINDSVTWCRFAQVNRYCNQLTKDLLIHEVHDLKYWFAHEYRTRLPCGTLHGEAKGYKRTKYYNKIAECDMVYNEYRHRWWYTKCYLSGKLHGYYTVSGVMAEFNNGVQIDSKFMSNRNYVQLGQFESAFWKIDTRTSWFEHGIKPMPNFLEFEQMTKL